jgi:hypothetical protein
MGSGLPDPTLSSRSDPQTVSCILGPARSRSRHGSRESPGCRPILLDLHSPVQPDVLLAGSAEGAEKDDGNSYGIVDAIAARAIASGARVLAVRQADLPDRAPLAAILRYAI